MTNPIIGWLPFLLFLVLAIVGCAIGYVQFLSL